MTPEEYKKKFGAKVTPDYYGTSWKNRMAAAEATALVDFDCRFNESGGCRRGSGDCCCSACPGEMPGLAPQLFPTEKDLAEVAAVCLPSVQRKWARDHWETVDHGFWRKETGCVLPRRLRTTLCLTFHCLRDQEGHQLTYAEKELLDAIKRMEPRAPESSVESLVQRIGDAIVEHSKKLGKKKLNKLATETEELLRFAKDKTPLTKERVWVLRELMARVTREYYGLDIH